MFDSRNFNDPCATQARFPSKKFELEARLKVRFRRRRVRQKVTGQESIGWTNGSGNTASQRLTGFEVVVHLSANRRGPAAVPGGEAYRESSQAVAASLVALFFGWCMILHFLT